MSVIQASIPRIKDALINLPKQEQPATKELRNCPFESEDIQSFWKSIIEQWNSSLPSHLRTLIQQIKADFSELPVITLEFPSLLSENQFAELKMQLVLSLREHFKNDFLTVQTKVVLRKHEKNFIKTKEEFFEELAAKNSVLLKLRDELGLI